MSALPLAATQSEESDAPERWSAVGRSTNQDSRAAGVEAASDALERGDAKLAVIFAGHLHDHSALLDGVKSSLGPRVPVIGCTTGGEFSVAGPTDGAVVVMILGGSGFSVATAAGDVIDGDLRSAGGAAATAVSNVEERGHTVLLLLSDGLAGDQQEVVRGAYAAVGAAVPLVGGCAGDGMQMQETKLFYDIRVASNMVVGAAISSDAPIGIGVFHGWEPVGDPVLITGSEGNVVFTIDEEPALDRYLRLHDAPPDLADDPEAFTTFAAIHPLGIHRRSREEVRFISAADPEARTITSIAEVPEGALAWAMTGTAESVLEATSTACRQAIEQLDGQPVGVLAFDCVARRGVMGDGITDEVARIRELAGSPIAGFYTYGEFARTQGASGFHNQTLVTLAIG